ncbi:MAG TPA: YXWGXW repeat-containing protein [Candidatus Sulfotelmatobacter sp.]|nr:YXWGXW repeat-containing protein [Candidatus Sulfotelmatobacter sp.]
MIRLYKVVAVLLFVVFGAFLTPAPASAQIAVGVSIHIGPPALPVYAQPVCPAPGYIWTPGYWAYGPAGYFWVPGTWILAPTPGFLWTPGYWGFVGGAYVWHGGYWGPHVGFYGGINYGFGYGGVGFVGGAWHGGVFQYNTAVTNVNTTIIHNTYVNNTVVNRTVVNNVSYNGGPGGLTAQPTAAERSAMAEHHVEPTAMQTQHEQMARSDRTMLASENHGHPAVAATAHPGVFKGEGVVASRATANSNRPNNAQMDRPPSARNNTSYSANNNHPNSNNSHYQDRPQTTNANHPNNSQQNNNHPNNSNNNHPNDSHPQQHEQHENRPPEHEGHPGGGRGR